MAEQVFCWAADVPRHHLDALRRLLDEIDRKPADNRLVPFARLEMVHFASLTLFSEDSHAEQPILVFESNVDGPYDTYVNTLHDEARAGLEEIFGLCEPRLQPGGDLREYLAGRRRKPQLKHVGHPGLTVREIRGDVELRRSIAAALDADPALRRQEPCRILQAIRTRTGVGGHPLRRIRYPWHRQWEQPWPEDGPIPDPTPLDQIEWRPASWEWWWALRAVTLYAAATIAGLVLVHLAARVEITALTASLVWGGFVFGLIRRGAQDARSFNGFVAAGIVTILVLLGIGWWAAHVPIWVSAAIATPIVMSVIGYIQIVRQLTVTAPPVVLEAEVATRVRLLAEAEDRDVHSIYNHVAGLSPMRHDWFWWRWWRTRIALAFLNLFYRTQFVKGKLATIPTIHFAQWNFIRPDQLLFVTNFDGGADSYLDDFFNTLANGVAFIWHDTTPFPHSTDTRRLKIWVREAQTLAGARYRAPVYRGLTVTEIMSNLYLRRRLQRGFGDASARRWLQRLATTPAEPSELARLSAWLRERFTTSG